RASPRHRSNHSGSAHPWWLGGLGAALLAFSQAAGAFQPDEAAALLLKADRMKTADPAGFATLLDSLAAQINDLTPPQQELVRYLQGWKSAWDGQYDLALARLRATIHETHDITLKFRANASIINVLVVGSHYEEALTQLTQLLVLLPRVTDP